RRSSDLAAGRTNDFPRDSVGRALTPTMTLLDVEGVVLDEPSTERPARGELAMFVRDTPATRFTLRVRAVHRGRQAEGATPASGDLWVRVEGEATRVRAGDAVRVRGQAFGIDAPMNPGERDFRPRARERNIAGRLLAPSPALVTPAENFE